jgi:hypothetical protein
MATRPRNPAARRQGRAAPTIMRKNYRIDMNKLRRTQRVLGTATETETIHRALDLVVNETALAAAIAAFIRLGRGLEDMDASRR